MDRYPASGDAIATIILERLGEGPKVNRLKRKTLDRLLIRRDGYTCGSHLGGCGMEACSSTETDIDHIFPQAFFRDTRVLHPRQYDSPWNVQRMHKACNNEAKGGFVFGFPEFKCKCHWLEIRKRGSEYALEISYNPPDGDVYRVVVVPYGKFDVGGEVSDPKGLLPGNEEHVVAAFIRAPPDRKMSISSITVDVEAAFASGRKLFSFVGKAKRGRFRGGENAHMFPVLTADEVVAFNQSEKNRVKRGGTVDDADNLLVTFNAEVIGFEMKYDELVSGKPESGES